MTYSDQGHLDYYKKFGISPVRYDLSDLDAHFDRRASLYRHLGLPEVAFRGAKVLEVAPGSGHNSLFVAQAQPATLDLVEPNPTGIRDIEETYAAQNLSLTQPTLHEQTFQEFEAGTRYDIVICENWLGSLPDERRMIGKLASLVAPRGVLVMTIVPPGGFLPNVLRKLMADRIVSADMPFEQKTDVLVKAFGPHLATIDGMTRSHRDWVRDCMINPHYLNVVLPLETVLAEVGSQLDILGSSPDFHTDWRWFKNLWGDQRSYNQAFEKSYVRNIHNFVDYRYIFDERTEEQNGELGDLFLKLHTAAIEIERRPGNEQVWGGSTVETFVELLAHVRKTLAKVSEHLSDALGEAGECLTSDTLDAETIADQKYMNRLFGRETIYVSLTRSNDPHDRR